MPSWTARVRARWVVDGQRMRLGLSCRCGHGECEAESCHVTFTFTFVFAFTFVLSFVHVLHVHIQVHHKYYTLQNVRYSISMISPLCSLVIINSIASWHLLLDMPPITSLEPSVWGYPLQTWGNYGQRRAHYANILCLQNSVIVLQCSTHWSEYCGKSGSCGHETRPLTSSDAPPSAY